MTGFHFTAYGPAAGYAPTGNGGVGPWLLPARSFEARSYQSAGIVVGQPGTMPVPAPDAAAIPPGNLPTMARGRIAWPLRGRSSSRDSPQVWLPAIYYQPVLPNQPADAPGGGSVAGGLGLGPNVSVVSDNMMPVPAIDPRGKPAVMAARPPRIGGHRQVIQPYSVVNWPKWVQDNPLPPA
ncbi:MAG: hypothetical protein J2P28_21750 [Actinobacteria bacterium]|nr:hypothetical protein [Actinomycetota bacterium]